MQHREFTLQVNGSSHRVQARPDEPLLWVLRDQLGLAGAKFGCGEGMCGACSVLINGRAQRTCRLAVSAVADGREIITIEGLGKPGDLSPVQKAFADHTAFGCGYCTPGQIVAATALLNRNPAPTRPQIVSAMNGHLCRCAAYPNILAAVESLVEGAEAIEASSNSQGAAPAPSGSVDVTDSPLDKAHALESPSDSVAAERLP